MIRAHTHTWITPLIMSMTKLRIKVFNLVMLLIVLDHFVVDAYLPFIICSFLLNLPDQTIEKDRRKR